MSEYLVKIGGGAWTVQTLDAPYIISASASDVVQVRAIGPVMQIGADGTVIGEFNLTTSAGVIGDEQHQPDGSVTFTLTGTAHDGEYTIPGGAVAAGLPVILTEPTVAESPAGTFSVTGDGLYVYPTTDEPSVFYEWDSDGVNIASGSTYTRTEAQETTEIGLTTYLVNVASENTNTVVNSRKIVQEKTLFTPSVSFFRMADKDQVRWGLDQMDTQYADRAVIFNHFRLGSDVDGNVPRGNIFSFGGRLTVQAGRDSSTGLKRLTVLSQAANPDTHAMSNSIDMHYLDTKPGMLISTIHVFGTKPNNHIWQEIGYQVDNGEWVFRNGLIGTNIASTVNVHASVEGVRLGGITDQWSPAGQSSEFEHLRSFMILGLSAENLPETPAAATELFIDANGVLKHPHVAQTVLGTPQVDFYNGQQHGSFPTPAIFSNLS